MRKTATIVLALLAPHIHAQYEQESWESEFEMGQLETVQGPGADPLVWDLSATIGNGVHSFSALSEGERVDGALDGQEFRLQYGHAVSDQWHMKLGVRKDTGTGPHKEWLEIGLEREMLYAVDTAVSAFVDKDGRSAARIEAEKAVELSAKWLLIPELTANFYSYNDEEFGTGSGLADLELAVRLAYEVTPHSAVYVGGLWGRSFGQTADYIRLEGEDIDDARAVLGVQVWF